MGLPVTLDGPEAVRLIGLRDRPFCPWLACGLDRQLPQAVDAPFK
jgi:hypothetical protein